jgi:hypothetical protein
MEQLSEEYKTTGLETLPYGWRWTKLVDIGLLQDGNWNDFF